MVAAVRGLEQILHMGGGKVDVLDLAQRGGKPALRRRIRPGLQLTERGPGDQIAVGIEHRDGHKGIPVFLIQQRKAVGGKALGQIGVFQNPVIHRVRHPHDPPQVIVQRKVHLGQHLLAGLRLHLLVHGGIPQRERKADEQRPRHSHRREGERDHPLDAHSFVGAGKPASQLPKRPQQHTLPPFFCC